MKNKPIRVTVTSASAVAPRVQWIVRDGKLCKIVSVATSAPNCTVTIGKEETHDA